MSQNCKKSRLYGLLDFLVFTATGVYLVGIHSRQQVGEIIALLLLYWLAKDAIQGLSRRDKTRVASVSDDEDDDWEDDDFDDEDDLDDDDLDDEDDDIAHDNWRIDADDEEEDIYGDEAELLEYEYGKAKRG